MSPKVSIIFPVYNAAHFLPAAIESIKKQIYEDFECIAIDDGSTDESGKLLDTIAAKDSRWKIIHQANAGLVASLNTAIGLARGTYIARMDADDISLPERLQKQVEFLDSHKDVGIVGCSYGVINEAGHIIGSEPVFFNDRDLRLSLLHTHTFAHGSVMIRATVLNQVSQPPYQSAAGYVEDVDLWTRIAKISRLAGLPEILYLWRKNPDSISHTKFQTQHQQVQAVYDRYRGAFSWIETIKTITWKTLNRYHTTQSIVQEQRVVLQYRRAISYQLVQLGKLAGRSDLRESARLLWFAFWLNPIFFLGGVFSKLRRKTS